MLAQPSKASYLIAGVLVISGLALTLPFAGPPEFAETGGRWALILWIINLVWILVAALGWKTLPLESLKRLPKDQQQRHLRSETIWFHLWKGGYLALVSVIILLIGIGSLSYLGQMVWVRRPAIGGYLLAFIFSLLKQRRLLRVVVEGWSADSRQGRWMLRLAFLGPVIGASIASGIGIILVRLHVLPTGFLMASVGLVAILTAFLIVPQIVQDFSVAWIHFQIRKTMAPPAAEKP